MKERRGAVGRLTGLAEGVAAAARRRQRDRWPRVLLYDEAGHPRVLPTDSLAFDALVECAERMIEAADRGGAGVADRDPGATPPSSGGVSVRQSRPEAGDEN